MQKKQEKATEMETYQSNLSKPSKTSLNRQVKAYQAKALTLGEI